MVVELSKKQINDGWQIVKFGEIAKNISKRVDPAETDLEVYVGLEHLDPQSLRIPRRGEPADVKGQKLRVRPGQIIFGKRRAYQKKVAVADFDGICSAHAMVLEEVVDKIIPGLLPFFMQSDMFMDRAVAISEGSLSPTIKWKTLAIQEFSVPPIDRQKEILKVLEKIQKSQDTNYEVESQGRKLIRALQMKFFHNPRKIKKPKKLETFISFITSGSRGWAKYYSQEGDLFLRITNFSKNTIELELSDLKHVKLPAENTEGLRTLVQSCDILISVTADIGLIGFIPENGIGQQAYVNQHIALIRPDQQKVHPRYLAYYLNSPEYYRYFLSLNGGGAKAGLSLENLKRIPIELPSIDSQKEISNILKTISDNLKSIQLKQLHLTALRSKYLSKVLFGEANDLQ